jgi:hypothetical protein
MPNMIGVRGCAMRSAHIMILFFRYFLGGVIYKNVTYCKIGVKFNGNVSSSLVPNKFLFNPTKKSATTLGIRKGDTSKTQCS